MVTRSDILDLLEPGQRRAPMEQLDDDLPLVQQGIDSLEMATLLFEVERKFDVSIPTDIVGRLNSLRDITEYINTAHASSMPENQ